MRLTGKVKWFNPAKHFGFIDLQDGRSIFVHESRVEGHQLLTAGDSVSFYVAESAKGLSAIAVERIEQIAPPVFQDLIAAKYEAPAE